MISCLCVALFCSFLNVFLITSFAYCLCIFCSILILIIRNLFLNSSSPFMVEKHFFSSFGWAFLLVSMFWFPVRFRSTLGSVQPRARVEYWWRNFREPWANLLSQTYTLARRSYSQISSLWCWLFVCLLFKFASFHYWLWSFLCWFSTKTFADISPLKVKIFVLFFSLCPNEGCCTSLH